MKAAGQKRLSSAPPRTSISIYWGSIDASEPGTPSAGNINSFAITLDGYTLTGVDLVAMYGAHGDGSHTDPLANQWVTISGLEPFTTAEFSSTRNAFEFSLGPTTVIPEPSTWAMMALGFAGLGYAAFRRNSKGQMAASVI